MNDLKLYFIYTLFYYQLDNILKPTVYNKFELFKENIDIPLYSIFLSCNYFILIIFLGYLIHMLFISKIINFKVYSLSFIYIKYTIDNIIYFNTINIYECEFRRVIMWLFTTPLILQLYCDINKISFFEINSQYHILANYLHIVLFYYRKTNYNIFFIPLLSLGEGYFIYNLFNFKHNRYTTFILFIWTLFSCVNIIEYINIINIIDIQMIYLICDMIAKLTTILIVNDYEEQTSYIKNNVDLQSINLLANIKTTIRQFETQKIKTNKCKMILKLIDNRITSFIPNDKTHLKLELLKKILPLELEEKYLTQTKEYKQFDFICVLFTDIVSYTELAKEYEPDVIYKLLNDVYTCFDDIINRYGNLQKIETIGDAYMVVSDIYTNDYENNVKNILLFAFDLLKEIKNISTPNKKPLQLRIGINLGTVVVGMLGVEIPRLCVIGNTVNVANRLQTNTEPNTIQISTHVHEIMEDIDFGFDIKVEKKENVFLKNLGSRTTYVITPNL